MNEDDVLWTVKDVAAFLQVPERKIWNKLRRSGYSWRSIPSVTMDGRPRFIPSQIRAWKEKIREHVAQANAPRRVSALAKDHCGTGIEPNPFGNRDFRILHN